MEIQVYFITQNDPMACQAQKKNTADVASSDTLAGFKDFGREKRTSFNDGGLERLLNYLLVRPHLRG